MAVLEALRQTPGALRRNPVVFVPTLVLTLFQIPQLALQAVAPLLASVVSLGLSLLFVLVMPFFQGGVVEMADEALDGRTSLSRFVSAGTENYVSILVAYLLLVAGNFVVGLVGFVAVLVGSIALVGGSAGAGGTGGPNVAALGVVGVALLAIVALVVLAYLLFVFFVQFYGQAIVVDGLGAIDGLKHSASVVRHNLVSTLGYTVLVGVVGGGAGLVFGLTSVLLSPRSSTAMALPHLSVPAAVGLAAVVAVLAAVFGGFFGVFSVAFYRTVNAGVDDSGP